jgi:bis(5'-adenosyl)-triphosphatase
MKPECPFCNKELIRNAFLRNKNFLAVYNIAPVLPGHALVIPVRHIESVFDFTPEELTIFGIFMLKTTRILLKAFNGEGFDWSLQEKECAGQSIPHLHFHIVVRKQGDLKSYGDWYPLIDQNDRMFLDSTLRDRLSADELDLITDHLKKEAKKWSEE